MYEKKFVYWVIASNCHIRCWLLGHRPIGDKAVHVATDPYAAIDIASGPFAHGSAHINSSIHTGHT